FAWLLHFDAQGVAFKSDTRVHGAGGLRRVVARCPQCFTRNSEGLVRGGEIEISARGGEDCLLLLRIEAVAGGFRKLMRFERFENRVADLRVRDDHPAWCVTLLVDFLNQPLGILDQVIVPAISYTG